MKRFLKNYGLSITLFVLFIFSWCAQCVTGWEEYVQEQKEHHESAKFFGEDGYVWQFLSATFENWQSEFFQVFIFVVLSTYLLHKNSPQSRDGDDEMLARIKHIEKILNDKK